MRQPDLVYRPNLSRLSDDPAPFSWKADFMPALAFFSITLALVWLL